MWRSVYVQILRLHPQAFRDEYAEEMQWIFDQEAPRRGALPLLFDGVKSLIRQRWRRPESIAFRPVAAGAPTFRRLDTRVFGGNPLTAGFLGAFVLLLVAFSLIVQYGYYPGLLRIPSIYEYGEAHPLNITPDWVTLQTLDADSDGWISPQERLAEKARRWEPLFAKAEAQDGRVSLETMRQLLLEGPYWYLQRSGADLTK